MAESIKTLHGKDTFLFIRKLKDAKTSEGSHLINRSRSLTLQIDDYALHTHQVEYAFYLKIES